MPGYDRSGPMGEGPMSGWGRGLCGSDQSGQTPAGYGRMAGRGRGGGFGFRGAMRCGFGRRAGFGRFGGRIEGDGEDLKARVDELRQSLTAIEQQLERIGEKDE